MSKRYTIGNCQAHTISGGTVIVPDEVGADQERYDGCTFPAVKLDPITGAKQRSCRVMLMGDLYDLHGPGTGNMVVRIVG